MQNILNTGKYLKNVKNMHKIFTKQKNKYLI